MNAPMRILVDGLCPFCRREGEFLRRLDRGRGRIAIIDIAAPGFDAGSYGTTIEAAMGRIHALDADGRLLSGLEVFRRAYALVCPPLGWLWAVTGWPGVRVVADAGYRWFARNRYRFGGGVRACDDGRCAVK